MAIQNLDFLRKLIAEVRQEQPFLDALRLRMLGAPVGTGTVNNGEGDAG
jgi:hypothetical protein